MKIFSEDEFNLYLFEAGFSDVKCFMGDGEDSLTKEHCSWLCVIAKK